MKPLHHSPVSKILDDWLKIQKLFPTRNAFRPNVSWWHGINTRVGPKRMSRLCKVRAAKALLSILEPMSAMDLKRIRVMARVNMEQVSSAFRTTVVLNISAPLAILALVNYMAPEGVGALWVSYFDGDAKSLIGFYIGACLGLVSIVWMGLYALATLSIARDILHLIDIHCAERQIFFDSDSASESD